MTSPLALWWREDLSGIGGREWLEGTYPETRVWTTVLESFATQNRKTAQGWMWAKRSCGVCGYFLRPWLGSLACLPLASSGDP